MAVRQALIIRAADYSHIEQSVSRILCGKEFIAGRCPLQFSRCQLRLRIEYATSSTVQQLLVWTAITTHYEKD